MMIGIVPKMKNAVMQWPVVKKNEFVSKFVDSPAGPFTSTYISMHKYIHRFIYK